jgi:hypothetical protein
MQDWQRLRVPDPIEPEVKILVEELQRQAGRDAPFAQQDVALIKSKTRQFDGGPLLETALFVASAQVFSWITKAWFEKHVLPIVLERVREPSEQFQEWFRQLLRVRDRRDEGDG